MHVQMYICVYVCMHLCLQRPYLTMGILICPILGYSMVLPILVVFGRWNKFILQMGIGQHDCLRYWDGSTLKSTNLAGPLMPPFGAIELVIVPKPQDLDISADCIFTQILVIFLMTHPISHWYPKDLPGSSTHMCFCLNPPVLMVKSFLFTTNIYQVCHHTVNPPLMNKTTYINGGVQKVMRVPGALLTYHPFS